MLAIWTGVAGAATVCPESSSTLADCDYPSVLQAVEAGEQLIELMPGLHVVNVTLQRPVHVRAFDPAEPPRVRSGQDGQPAFLVEGPSANGTVLEDLAVFEGQLLRVERASVEASGIHSRREGPELPLLEVLDAGALQLRRSDLYDFQLLAPLVAAQGASLVVQGGVLAATASAGQRPMIEGTGADVSLRDVALLGRGLPALLGLEGGSLQAERILLQGGGQQGGLRASEVGQVTLSSVVLRDMDRPGLLVEGVASLAVTELLALRNEAGALEVRGAGEVALTWSAVCDSRDAVSVDALSFGLTHTLFGWNRGAVLEGVRPLPWFGTLFLDNASEPPWPVPEGNPARPGPPPLGPLSCEDLEWLSAWAVGLCPDCVDQDGDLIPGAYDCDDERPDRFPGAPERVGDAVDQDCDGQDACWDGSQPGPDFDCDQDGVRFAEDCNDRESEVGRCELLLASGCRSGGAMGQASVVLGVLGLLGRGRDARRRRWASPGEEGRRGE